jgi:hypothetical protein
MTLQHLSQPDDDSSQADSIDRMGAWTLGNLEQAFEQALDEAFRTCSSILDEIDPQQDGGDEGSHVSVSQRAVSPVAVPHTGPNRFRSCDGPVADSGFDS